MTSLASWLDDGGGSVFDSFNNFGSPYSSDIWDPIGRRGGGGGTTSDDTALVIASAKVDWHETDSTHVFRADLPGVKKEEVKVQIEDGNILQISGEHTQEEDQDRDGKDDKWHRHERRRGSFTRRFRLPENVRVDDIKCTMENGVLTVCVPKHVSGHKNVRSIDIA